MAVLVLIHMLLGTLSLVTSAPSLDGERPERAIVPLSTWQGTPGTHPQQGTRYGSVAEDVSISSLEEKSMNMYLYLSRVMAQYMLQGETQRRKKPSQTSVSEVTAMCPRETSCEESADMACCWVPGGPPTEQCVPKIPTHTASLVVNQQTDTRKAMLDNIRRQIREFDEVPRKSLQVLVLPVGQGDCIAMYCPNGNMVMYDCGSTQPKNALSDEELKDVLMEKNRRATIFISHADYDHYVYLPIIFNDTEKVDRVIIGGYPNYYHNKKRNKIEDWMHAIADQGKLYAINECRECIGNCSDRLHTVDYAKDTICNYKSSQMTSLNDMNICGSPDISFDIIAANNIKSDTNEVSIVLKVTAESRSVLFTGDMEGPAAKRIAKTKPNRLKSNILQISHHGASSNANKWQWLQAIQPEEAFVSHAFNGREHHPQCKAIQNLISVGSISTQVPSTLPFYCGNGSNLYAGEICHRIYSTYPAEDKICTILLEVGGSPRTTYTCFSVTSTTAQEYTY